MPTRLNLLPAIIALAAAIAPPAQLHADWGTLSGRLVYEGAPIPTPEKIQADKDPQVCGKHELLDERLVVAADGGLRNVMIFLRTEDVEPAPSYSESAAAEVVVEWADCRYEPHVVVMRTTQTLLLKNCDQIGHNSNGLPLSNGCKIIPDGVDTRYRFAEQESLPAKVGCNIHPWESGWILIRKSPYTAVSSEGGYFTIKDLPAGRELEFQLWQETAGFLKRATIDGVTVDAKGRFKLTIKPGDNNLGNVKVAAELFASR